MNKIENLKIKRITIVIPYTKHSLYINGSLGVKKNKFIDKRNEKRAKKGKKIKLKEIGPFEYEKGSEINCKLLDKRWFMTGWETYVGRWKLKGVISEFRWELRKINPLNGFLMATADVNDKSLNNILGENPFDGTYKNRKFNMMIDEISNFSTKHTKPFGVPTLFFETEDFDYDLIQTSGILNKVIDRNNNFIAIREYFDGNNPFYVIPFNDEIGSGSKYWMSFAYYDQPTVQRLFVRNIIEEITTGHDMSFLDEIVIRRYINYLENRVKPKKTYKEYQLINGREKMEGPNKIMIEYLGDIVELSMPGENDKKRAKEFMNDLLLQISMEEKKKNKIYNIVILCLSLASTVIALTTVLASLI